MKLLISGRNGSKNDSIFHATLSGDGKLIFSFYSHGVENPNFMCMSRNGRCLYTVIQENAMMGIASFVIDGGNLIPTGEVRFPGSSLCHLSLNEKENLIAASCYGSGDVYFYALDGKDNAAYTKVTHFHYGDESFQSHPHCIIPSKNERFMYLADLGLDRVVAYSTESGRIHEQSVLNLKKDDGPRHLLNHPTLDIMYLITEYSNVMYVFSSDEETGTLCVLQRLSTLKEYEDVSYAASLTLSTKRGLLYGSNRGADNIVVFSVSDSDGSIEYLTEVPCGGVWPRHIDLSKDDRYLFVANERSDKLSVLPLDDKGIPTVSVTDIPIKKASFMLEL